MSNYTKFRIREFKFENMVKSPSILAIGKRGAGKSWLIRDMLYHYRKLPCAAVISPTDRMNGFYKHFVPDSYIHHEAKEATIQKILLRQSHTIEKKKIDPSAVVVMDDCLARKKSWAKDQNIMEFLMNSRHYKLTYILAMQTAFGIEPMLRLNFDYVFLLKEDSTINKKRLWDNYASMFPNFEIFDKVFNECTKDNRVMVIDNRKPSDKIEDKVFWFKAQEREFVFGCQEYQDLHKTLYDSNHLKRTASDKNTTINIDKSDYAFEYLINEDKIILSSNQQNKDVSSDSKLYECEDKDSELVREKNRERLHQKYMICKQIKLIKLQNKKIEKGLELLNKYIELKTFSLKN